MVKTAAGVMMMSGSALRRADPVRARTRAKTREKPAGPRKTAVVRPRLVQPVQPDIDDDADDRQRVGVQSLGRAFAILEEVARHREGVGLAELSKLVGLHNSTTFHLAKTMVSLVYDLFRTFHKRLGESEPDWLDFGRRHIVRERKSNTGH